MSPCDFLQFKSVKTHKIFGKFSSTNETRYTKWNVVSNMFTFSYQFVALFYIHLGIFLIFGNNTLSLSDAPTCKNEKVMVVGASRGESVDIVCEIESDPPAMSYRWKFNNSGETLDVAAERFAKTSNGSVSVLRYTPVSELDYGSLSCWATNSVGHQVNPCVFQVVAAGQYG